MRVESAEADEEDLARMFNAAGPRTLMRFAHLAQLPADRLPGNGVFQVGSGFSASPKVV